MNQTNEHGSEYEETRKIIQKAMAYDLMGIIRKSPNKTYTVKELEERIHTYIMAN